MITASGIHPPPRAVPPAVAVAFEEGLLPLGDVTSGLLPEGIAGAAALVSRAAFAASGADLVSVGALTHSAPVLGIGLDLEVEQPPGLG